MQGKENGHLFSNRNSFVIIHNPHYEHRYEKILNVIVTLCYICDFQIKICQMKFF